MKKHLVCPLCGQKLVVYGKSARAWHEKCVMRDKKLSAPEYVEDVEP